MGSVAEPITVIGARADDVARKEVRDSTHMDFYFIVIYMLMSVLICVALGGQRHGSAGERPNQRIPWLAIAALVTGTLSVLTALADVRENLRILNVLDLDLASPRDELAIAAVHEAPALKWSLSFLLMA